MEYDKSNYHLKKTGLADENTMEYELESEFSWIVFGRDINRPTLFTIYMIGTQDDKRNQGHATRLLDVFFRMVSKLKGEVKTGVYTAAGSIAVKHVIDRLSKKYGVRIIQ